MANLPETPQWEDGIYQIEVSDPVLGGPDGISNRQGKQLASRTLYLKQQVEKGGTDLAKHIAAADPHTQYAPKASPTFTGTPTAPTPANSDNSKKLATTEFVAKNISALANTVAGKLSQDQNGADIPDKTTFLQNLGLMNNGVVGRLVNIKVITTSQVYIPTPGTKKIVVEVQGAGGAGGGSQAVTAGNCSIGAGGAEGCYGKSIFTDLEDSYSISIGAGGVGVQGAGGGAGGITTFGDLMSAGGGFGGATLPSGSTAVTTGLNAPSNERPVVIGANLYSSGYAGTFVFAVRLGASSIISAVAGMGGRSAFGDGGGSHTAIGTGPDANAFGSGGGGAKSWSFNGTDIAYAGGRGADGVVIVWEYA